LDERLKDAFDVRANRLAIRGAVVLNVCAGNDRRKQDNAENEREK